MQGQRSDEWAQFLQIRSSETAQVVSLVVKSIQNDLLSPNAVRLVLKEIQTGKESLARLALAAETEGSDSVYVAMFRALEATWASLTDIVEGYQTLQRADGWRPRLVSA